MSGHGRGIRARVGVVAAAGAAVLATCTAAAWAPSVHAGTGAWALAVVLAALVFVVDRRQFIFPWRGERVAIAFDDAAVLLALVMLPALALPLVLAVPSALVQVARRRPAMKATFNIAAIVLGAGAAAGVAVAVAPWTGALVGAILGMVAFALVTNLLVGMIVAASTRASFRIVLVKRILSPLAIEIAVGASFGVTILSLYSFHPLAVLAVAPLVFLAREFALLRERNEHITVMQKGATRLRLELAMVRAPEEVAHKLIEAAGALLPASCATVAIRSANLRVTRAFPRRLRLSRTISAPLVAHDGALLGMLELEVDARDGSPLSKMGASIARLFADEAAAALARLDSGPRTQARWIDLPGPARRAA